MPSASRGCLPLWLIILFFASACAEAPDKARLVSGDVVFDKPVRNWKDLKEENVVMQGYDYSCGASALATLLRYYFGQDIDEMGMLKALFERLSGDELKDREKNGFSLLDLRNAAAGLGYQAVGVKLNFKALIKLKGPVLVHLQTKDFKHFAIFRGIVEDRIYLADPSRGNIRLAADSFAQEWTGFALVLGKEGFGLPSEHLLAVRETPPIRNELQEVRRALFSRFPGP